MSQKEERPELVFALVGAIGTDQTKVSQQLMTSLSRYGYETPDVIHLIERVHDFPRWSSKEKYRESPYNIRVDSHMTMGDEFREACDDPSALALLGIEYLRQIVRPKAIPDDDVGRAAPGHAYIFRSLKNPEEAELLRRIYQPNFFLLGTYTNREQRISRLSARIAESHQSARPADFRSQAEKLNTRDQVETGRQYGQNVEATFPLADAFIDCSNESTSQEEIDRLVDMIFGHPYRTPTRDEFAMFHAQGAALRSSDMDRSWCLKGRNK